MKIKLAMAISLILIIICGQAVGATSLWNSGASSLYGTSTQNFNVGDLLTLIIVEQSNASHSAGSSSGKDGSVSLDAGTGKLKGLLPEMSGGWETDYEGTGTTTRGGSLSAKITVKIIEITPEGLLSLEGKQNIQVNKEEQVLTVSGKVRPKDVTSSNTVYSTYLADAAIDYQGYGTLGDVQRTGILTRIFNWIF